MARNAHSGPAMGGPDIWHRQAISYIRGRGVREMRGGVKGHTGASIICDGD